MTRLLGYIPVDEVSDKVWCNSVIRLLFCVPDCVADGCQVHARLSATVSDGTLVFVSPLPPHY